MSNLFYPILVTALSDEDGGGFAAYVPDLYGCMSDGATAEEALGNAQLAIREWCDEARSLGREVPAPYSARERAQKDRDEISKVMARQAEAIDNHRENFDRIASEVESIKTMVEALAEKATESAPWDIVPIYAKKVRDPHLPH